ncbi:flagellar basal body-associated FliL family protein [Planctomicrobium sp. SH668]|uniref:flagellar basal body-associated FliL family protein n=1 Tax=Planctomicrobium sp. SH668 TaxID=3448126 RepID=UPI003F5C02BA
MSEIEKTDAKQSSTAGGGGVLVWAMIALVAAGVGVAVPFAVKLLAAQSHGHGGGSGTHTASSNGMKFLPYREVTVNLDEARMNRYLRIKIVLHIREADEKLITAAIAKNDLILRNWMVSHLSDKELDDIRGKAGLNMLRREIRDYFNSTLFDDKYERIYDVLFDEFNVQ